MSPQFEQRNRSDLTFFQLLILMLSIYVLAALFIQVAVPVSPETTLLLELMEES